MGDGIDGFIHFVVVFDWLYVVLERKPWLSCFICPRMKCLKMSEEGNPGHVEKKFCLIAAMKVDLVGKKPVACKCTARS